MWSYVQYHMVQWKHFPLVYQGILLMGGTTQIKYRKWTAARVVEPPGHHGLRTGLIVTIIAVPITLAKLHCSLRQKRKENSNPATIPEMLTHVNAQRQKLLTCERHHPNKRQKMDNCMCGSAPWSS